MRTLPQLAPLALFALLALAACERRTPGLKSEPAVAALAPAAPDAAGLQAPDAAAEPPPSEPVRVPAGCEINLSGRYRARDDVAWRYAIEDDGRRLVARREPAETAGESTTMVLQRTAEGFVGEVRGAARTAGGRDCAVGFPAEVVACRAGTIVLHSVDALSIDERCERVERPGEPTEKVLLRD